MNGIVEILLIVFIFAIIVKIGRLTFFRNRIKYKENIINIEIDTLYSFVKGKLGEKAKFNNFDEECAILSTKETILLETKRDMIAYYRPLYDNLVKINTKELSRFSQENRKFITNYIKGFKEIESFIDKHNEQVLQKILEKYKTFFDTCLKYPLDEQQRRSIASQQNQCLVISSAGSGKTTSIVGKVLYLTKIKHIDAKKILLISFTRKAANELTERIGIDGLQGYTFHKLALDIISNYKQEKPAIAPDTNIICENIVRKQLKDTHFKSLVCKYITQRDFINIKDEGLEKHKDEKRYKYVAKGTDSNGNKIRVKSLQEKWICLILQTLGVEFLYEEPYEIKVADKEYSQYKPDFSIYYEKDGKQKRIYFEHFGVDKDLNVASWFADDYSISYSKANEKYNESIEWKKNIHKQNNTTMIYTTSADFPYQKIKKKIKKMLQDNDVPIHEMSEEEENKLILPENDKEQTPIINLITTFISLLKTNCKNINDVLDSIRKDSDKYSEYMVSNIFMPIYNLYEEYLRKNNLIDFSDCIHQATEIIEKTHLYSYDYIIVDEFQDISIDRYKFLQALQNSTPKAKLYCVGDDWQSIYRFSGSDISLFNQFEHYFGISEIDKIETTYRFGEPLISFSSNFVQKNPYQIKKHIRPFNKEAKTDIELKPYLIKEYKEQITEIVSHIPQDKQIFFLGRYSFDDYDLKKNFKCKSAGQKIYYLVDNRWIEFQTIHKSKGLEADYVIILSCNNDNAHNFPSKIEDDPSIKYLLSKSEKYPFAEERRLFYVAITRAKIKTYVLYKNYYQSTFIDEASLMQGVYNNFNANIGYGNHFLANTKENRQKIVDKHKNAYKKWDAKEETYLLQLYNEGKTIPQIAKIMQRSYTSIHTRLEKLL